MTITFEGRHRESQQHATDCKEVILEISWRLQKKLLYII